MLVFGWASYGSTIFFSSYNLWVWDRFSLCYHSMLIWLYFFSIWWCIAQVRKPPCRLNIFVLLLTTYRLGRIFGTSKCITAPAWVGCCPFRGVSLLFVIDPLFNVLPNLCLIHVLFFITKNRELVVLLQLSYWCLVAVSVLWLLYKVRWFDLQNVIVLLPDHTLIYLFF